MWRTHDHEPQETRSQSTHGVKACVVTEIEEDGPLRSGWGPCPCYAEGDPCEEVFPRGDEGVEQEEVGGRQEAGGQKDSAPATASNGRRAASADGRSGA